MSNCIIKIREALSTLSKQEKKVANYILKHKSEVASITISDLSSITDTSTATINRFCNSIGYKGFRDFSLAFYHDYMIENSDDGKINVFDLDDDLTSNLSLHETIEAACKLNAESIYSTLDIIDEEEIKKAVRVIDKANKVVVYALSGSKVVAHDVVFKFLRLGIDARYYETVHDQILSEALLTSKDVAIFITYSGETKDIVAAANIVSQTGAKTIGITRYGENSVSKLCDINIQHATMGKGSESYSTRSRVVQENVIDILFLALCQIRKENLKHYYELLGHRNKISRL